MELGLKLKKLRETKEISQEVLANMLDISQTKLSNIENGRIKKNIDFLLMKKICEVFDLCLKDFLVEKSITTPLIKDSSENNKLDITSNNILKQIESLIHDNIKKEEKIKALEAKLKMLSL